MKGRKTKNKAKLILIDFPAKIVFKILPFFPLFEIASLMCIFLNMILDQISHY